MKIKTIFEKEISRKILAAVILLVIALTFIFALSKIATNPNTYTKTLSSIDEKKMTVTAITTSAAVASTGLAMVPGDATTPIANELADIGSYLLIVVCVLVLEKSLLTVMGYLSCNILIPAACLLFGIYLFIEKRILKELAIKFAVFGILIIAIIPFSLKISDMIYDANKHTVDQVVVSAEDAAADTEENKNWLSSTLDKIETGVAGAGETAKKILNTFIDAIAIFIISYCAIPILIILLLLWIVKILFGITIPENHISGAKKALKGFQGKQKELLSNLKKE